MMGQNLNNLPAELLLLKRFFLCGCELDGVFNPKAPVVKAWTNPKNQHYYNKVKIKDKRQVLGFDISGHGGGVDYAVLDFDHVLDDNGNFVNDAAQKWYNYAAFSGTYIEKSVSGHGLHAIFKPTDGEFEKMASGSNARFDLGGGACIEIFYKTGRQFILTGDVFDCEPKTPISTDCSVIRDLLTEIAKNSTQNKKENQPKIDNNANQQTALHSTPYSANPPEYESARQIAMLNAINPAQLSYSDWLAVISACKNLGISESIVDAWNKRDAARYDEHKNKVQYDSLNDPSFDIETLHGIAKKFGYVEKDFKRQWYKDNPQFADRRLYYNTDFDIKQHFERAGLDYIPLNSFATAENAESRNFITPKDYAVTTAGVFKIDSKGKVKQISKAPICISELYFRNVDDTRLVDIWTRDTDGRILIIDRVDKAVIFDAKKITALSARGLSVTSSTSKDLVDYFADYIDANKKNLNLKKLLNKLGWLDEDLKFFVTPYDKRFALDWERLGNFPAELKQRGSFDAWKELAKEVIQNSVARFTLAACLAPPLLRILGERTFSIYLMCDSKAGKSAVVKFGGSSWGGTGIVRNLRATVNGIEGELSECTDFPFIADEKQLAEKMDMAKLSYLIAQGEGKGRMTKDARPKQRAKWWTIGILTGEEPITDDVRTQGAITRTMSIVVKSKKIISAELATKIYNSINQHYGYAGQFFVDNLVTENYDDLRDLKGFFIIKLAEKTGEKLIDDYRRYIALISVADYLMQKYFFDATDAEKAVENSLVNAYAIAEMIESQKELSDATREWNLISGWIIENRGLLLGNTALEKKDNGEMPVQNRIIGVYENKRVYIIVKALQDECRRQRLNYSKVVRDLDSAGYIIRGKDRPTQQKKIDGINTRTICLNLSFDVEKKSVTEK